MSSTEQLQQPIGNGMYSLRWSVPAHRQAEYHRWYDERRLFDVLSKPGLLAARRFARVPGIPFVSDSPFNFITIYQLSTAAAVTSDEFKSLATNATAEDLSMGDLPVERDILVQAYPERGTFTERGIDDGPSAAIGGALLHITMVVERSKADELAQWHNEEHIKDVVAVPGVLGGRRFVDASPALGSSTVRFVTCYELANVGVASSPDLGPARQTERRAKLEGCYTSHVQVYQQISPERGALVL